MPVINNIAIRTKEVPDIVGKMSGKLLIMGCGASLWPDLDKYNDHHVGHRMAINDFMLHYNAPLEHGISMHGEAINLFALYRRRVYGRYGHMITHSYYVEDAEVKAKYNIPEYVWETPHTKGSTGLLAVAVGLLMGYEEIILAGMPMDNGGHYYDPCPFPLMEVHFPYWEFAAKKFFNGQVKSLSGNTRELLGAPAGF